MQVFKRFLLEPNSKYNIFVNDNNKLQIQTNSENYYSLNDWPYYYLKNNNSFPFLSKANYQRLFFPESINNILEKDNNLIINFTHPKFFNSLGQNIEGINIIDTNINEIKYNNYCRLQQDNNIIITSIIDQIESIIEIEQQEDYYFQWEKFVYKNNGDLSYRKVESIQPSKIKGTFELFTLTQKTKLTIRSGNEMIPKFEDIQGLKFEGESKQLQEIGSLTMDEYSGNCFNFIGTGLLTISHYNSDIIDQIELNNEGIYLWGNEHYKPLIRMIKINCSILEFSRRFSSSGPSSDYYEFYINNQKIRLKSNDIIKIESKNENYVFDINYCTEIILNDNKEIRYGFPLNTYISLIGDKIEKEQLDDKICLSGVKQIEDYLTKKIYNTLSPKTCLKFYDDYYIDNNKISSSYGNFIISETLSYNIQPGTILAIQPTNDFQYDLKVNGNICNLNRKHPVFKNVFDLKNSQLVLENPYNNKSYQIDFILFTNPEGVKEVNNKMKQYYFNPAPPEYTIDLDLNIYTKIGIQALPGANIYFNGKYDPIIIGNTGIFEIDLKDYGYINQIKYDGNYIPNVEYNDNGQVIEGPTPFLIIDLSE